MPTNQGGYRLLTACLLLAALFPATTDALAQSAELAKPRVWKGKNGKSFKGQYLSEEGDVILVYAERLGKTYRIKRSNLSEETLAWLDAAKKPKSSAKATSARPHKGYSKIDFSKMNRLQVPEFGEEEKVRAGTMWITDCFAPFLLWWDGNKTVEITRGGKTPEEKRTWIRAELSSGVRAKAGPNEMQHVQKTLERHLKRHTKDEVRVTLEELSVSSSIQAAELTRNSAATMAYLTSYSGKESKFWFPAAIVTCHKDGSIAFDIYGKRFTGTMTPSDEKFHGPGDNKFVPQKITLDPGSKFPNHHFSGDETHFVLRRGFWTVNLFKKDDEKNK